jgi:hypothetical protein
MKNEWLFPVKTSNIEVSMVSRLYTKKELRFNELPKNFYLKIQYIIRCSTLKEIQILGIDENNCKSNILRSHSFLLNFEVLKFLFFDNGETP